MKIIAGIVIRAARLRCYKSSYHSGYLVVVASAALNMRARNNEVPPHLPAIQWRAEI